jgi:uncharacterized protein
MVESTQKSSCEEYSMVSQDLLEILRCPYCVSGETRRPGDDPGRLQLINNAWLVCTEAGCNRKYPIREDIPIMLIEEGDKYRDTPVEKLGQP